jgi:hypothetical protein
VLLDDIDIIVEEDLVVDGVSDPVKLNELLGVNPPALPQVLHLLTSNHNLLVLEARIRPNLDDVRNVLPICISQPLHNLSTTFLDQHLHILALDRMLLIDLEIFKIQCVALQ